MSEYDLRKLKSLIVMKGLSNTELCRIMKISSSAYYCKMSGRSDFTRGEIEVLINVLNLSMEDTLDIFFTQKVS